MSSLFRPESAEGPQSADKAAPRTGYQAAHSRAGDYLVINDQGGRKKLKDYMIDEKIPQKQRDQLWLLADGSHILWIIGYRQNQAYQVTDKTRRILEIEFNGGEEDGRESKSISS